MVIEAALAGIAQPATPIASNPVINQVRGEIRSSDGFLLGGEGEWPPGPMSVRHEHPFGGFAAQQLRWLHFLRCLLGKFAVLAIISSGIPTAQTVGAR